MGRSTASRRASEFVGVALFAAALIWIVALASYEPGDPVWFFSTDAHAAPANFAGRIGAFLAELSFQLFGYASYVIPAAMVIIGWHYFWCRSLDAAGTKATGADLLVACISAFLSLIFGTLEVSGKAFRASEYAGVSTPVTWREIEQGFNRREFTIRTVPARLAEVGDLWAALRKSKGVDLTAVTRIRT